MARKKHIQTPALDKLNAVGIDAICEMVAECRPLMDIAKEVGVGFGYLSDWLSRPEHLEKYARAREAQADRHAEEILRIADDGKSDTYIDEHGNERVDQEVVARSKLRVDARKWLASKMRPKVYGDKLDLGGHVGMSNLTNEQLIAQTQALASGLGIELDIATLAKALPSPD